MDRRGTEEVCQGRASGVAARSARRAVMSLLIALLSVFCASPRRTHAAATTEQDAAAAVKGWLRATPSPLGAALGQAVAKVEAVKDRLGVTLFHVVHLDPAGYVLVAPDDRLEPILAFSAQTDFNTSPQNPLVDILSGTVPARLKAALQPGATEAAAAGSKWKKLSGAAELAPGQEQAASSVSDPRVDPLVVTQWGQGNVAGAACYNYYTPPHAAGSTNNYVCGCVATAMAQVLAYWGHPTAGVGTGAHTITVDGTNYSRNLRGGDGAGGPYNYGQMVRVPDSSTTTAQRQAMGALTADAGVMVGASYTSSDTTAYLSRTPAAFSAFSYANARYGWNGNNDLGSVRNIMINPNLDAGAPTILGIVGSSRHAVVCDGYGYIGGTLYHHLNMGWNGSQNYWYNLPTVDDAYYGFSYNEECVYNISPKWSGETISGRIFDANGNALSGATVTAYPASGTANYTIFWIKSDSRGIWGLAGLNSSTPYNFGISLPGYWFADQMRRTGSSANNSASCGNIWGLNFRAGRPRVRGDLNGDGKADLILEKPDGTLVVWPVNSSGNFASEQPITNSAGSPLSPDGGFDLVGCADFDNDGKQDLVFQDYASGYVCIWFMDGLVLTADVLVTGTDGNPLTPGSNSGWKIVACGDFNGDGRPDILFQNYGTGQLSVWVLNHATTYRGLSVTDRNGHTMSLGSGSGGWTVVGSGDFNGDGKNDILWQNYASGQTSVWLMDGNVYTGSAWLTNSAGHAMNLGANSGGWRVAACGDYTGDGKTDIVWQDSQGNVSLWKMNGTACTGGLMVHSGVGLPLTLGSNSGGWTVSGCGDINGNGKAEILWQHTASGALSAWATSGYWYAGSMSIKNGSGQAMGLGTNSAGWRAVGFADFNRNGKPDLLLQNDAQGLVSVWFLNGTTFTGSAMVTNPNGQALNLGVASGGWRVAGAADFNRDGKPDLLLQNDAQGLLTVWYLNGTVFTGGSYISDSGGHALNLGANSGGWRAAACGDVNGDGRPDVLLQNDAQGTVTVWLLNGSTFQSGATVQDSGGHAMNMGADSAGWRIRGYGDINGDGKCEILWQHQATGYTSMWTMRGATYTGSGMILDSVGVIANPGGTCNMAPR